MKAFCIAMLFCIAGVVSAQPFDLKYCTAVQGPQAAEGCTTYHPATVDDLQAHRARFVGVLKVSGQVKSSGGPYTMTLIETVTDQATGKNSGSGPIVLNGLKAKDVGKVMHAVYKASDEHVKWAESR